MSLALTDARTNLHTVLVPLLPEGRVHLYPPAQMVAPCAWIDQPSWSIVDGLTVAEYPIHIVADGNPSEQCRLLDGMADAAWTLMAGPYVPLECIPGSVSAGATDELHQYTITVQVCVDAVTFCPPDPTYLPAWPA